MYQIIKKENWKTANWAGGTTNEVFIYPSGSNYQNREFKARISVATTYREERSQFTKLDGVDRFISKLDGVMKLEHMEHYKIDLEKYQIDRFKGNWDTFSTGKFRDFNLMLKGIRGDLYFSDVKNSSKFHLENNSTLAFLFLIEGSLIVNDIELEKEDLLVTDINILNAVGNAKVFYGFIKEWE